MERLLPPVHSAKAQETASALRAAALECVVEHGLRGTTSRAIADRAGVALGAITYHFGSKDELIAQVLVGAVRQWLEPGLAVLRSDADPATRTLRAVEVLRSTFDEGRALLPAYFEAHLAATRVPAVRRRIRALLDEVRALLVDQVRQLKEAGLVPEWAQPEAIADLQLAIADGLALQAMQRGRRFDPSAAAGQFASLLIAAGASSSPPAGSGRVGSRRGDRS